MRREKWTRVRAVNKRLERESDLQTSGSVLAAARDTIL